MPDIIHLDEHRPHEAGPVVCLRCGRSWVAVRPAGVKALECPECGAEMGASLMTMLDNAEMVLGDECCGQVDSAGICSAPACIRGAALKLVDSIKTAYFLEHKVHEKQKPDL